MKTLINLNNLPLVNNLKPTADAAKTANRYPLCVVENENLMFHLDTVIEPTEMFETYEYRSAINIPYIEHCKNMWNDIKLILNHIDEPIKSTMHIVDIGGNDGSLLKAFKSENAKSTVNLKLTNVDASKSFKEDNEKENITYIQNFWGNVTLPEKADVIVSTNVFQHNSDVHKFLSGIRDNLDGIWVLEFPYFLRTAETNQFDQIYHEHYFYWLLTPLVKLFDQYGLTIVSVSEHAMHGGSLRIVSTNKKKPIADNCKTYMEMESKFDFSRWADFVKQKIQSDIDFISKLKGKIACFGAAAKGCVYLNCLGSEVIDKISYVVDDTLGKQNKFVPGTTLHIKNREYLYNDQPEYLIILAHNFKDHIIKSLRPKYSGKILVMLPEISFYA